MATPTQTQKRQARERFAVASRMEREYLRSLRHLVNHIGRVAKQTVKPRMTEEDLKKASARLQRLLRNYSEQVEPWANTVATKMVTRIAAVEEASWIRLGKEMGRSLRKELAEAPTGGMLRDMLREQVKLIKSLPLEAAERVHQMTLNGIASGERADSIANKILETSEVTLSRARLIARTEVARTAAGLTMARSQHIGSTHYYWRSSGDGSVRESHKRMNGKIIAFDTPPEVEPGKFYHAGMFPNCRCYIQPILDQDE